MANKLGEYGGTRRSRQFSGNIDLPKWDSSKNLGGGWSRKGKGAMGTLDRSCPFNWDGSGDVG